MTYEDIYSRFYTLMTDPQFYEIPQNDAYSIMSNWLHDAVSVPYIRKVFSSITLDDEVMSLTYSLNNSVDGASDEEFVLGIFSQFMLIEWYRHKTDTAVNLAMMVGGKEEKLLRSPFSDATSRLETLEKQLRKRIRDYGYENNDYIGDDS